MPRILRVPVGIAALNHRLIAATPPGSEPLPDPAAAAAVLVVLYSITLFLQRLLWRNSKTAP